MTLRVSHRDYVKGLPLAFAVDGLLIWGGGGGGRGEHERNPQKLIFLKHFLLLVAVLLGHNVRYDQEDPLLKLILKIYHKLILISNLSLVSPL